MENSIQNFQEINIQTAQVVVSPTQITINLTFTGGTGTLELFGYNYEDCLIQVPAQSGKATLTLPFSPEEESDTTISICLSQTEFADRDWLYIDMEEVISSVGFNQTFQLI